MPCAPAESVEIVHDAVRLLPVPVSVMVAHPPMTLAPSLNATVPVGALPDTVAVKVTLVPTGAGFIELASVVVVDPADDGVTTWTVSVLGLAPITLNVTG